MREAGVAVEYDELRSDHGHDGFLAEPEQLAPLLRRALGPAPVPPPPRPAPRVSPEW